MSVDGGARPRPHPAVDLGLVLLALGLVVFTAGVIIVPAAAPAIVNDRLDIAIITAVTLVSVAVAALNWARGRVSGDGAALLRGSAFAVLAVLNGLILLVQLVGADAAFGASLDAPGQLPLLAGVLGRGLSAALLIGAGILALRAPSVLRISPILLIGPAALLACLLVLGAQIQDRLPALVDASILQEMMRQPVSELPLGSAPRLVVAQALVGIGFVAAAVLAYRSWRSNRRLGQAFLAAGFMVAAFS